MPIYIGWSCVLDRSAFHRERTGSKEGTVSDGKNTFFSFKKTDYSKKDEERKGFLPLCCPSKIMIALHSGHSLGAIPLSHTQALPVGADHYSW